MLNRTVLVGRLTRDPELRYLANGTAVCSLTIAVNRPFSNQQGEKQADYIPVVVWKRQAENAANYLKKSSLAGIDGRIQTRSYDNNEGKRVYITEVVADSVQFLEPKKTSNQVSSNPADYDHNFSKFDNDPFSNAGTPLDIDDSDLPF